MFASWLDFVEWRCRARVLVDRVLARCEQKQYLAPWNTWRAYVIVLSTSSVRQERLARFVLRIQRSGLWKILQRWSDRVAERIESRDLVGRCLRRLQNTKLRAALHTWSTSLIQMVACEKMLLRWQQRTTSGALEGWVDYVDRRADARATVNKVIGRLRHYGGCRSIM